MSPTSPTKVFIQQPLRAHNHNTRQNSHPYPKDLRALPKARTSVFRGEEVIVISSSEDEGPPVPKRPSTRASAKSSKQASPRKLKNRALRRRDAEVVEMPTGGMPAESLVAMLKKENEGLKQKLQKLAQERDLAQCKANDAAKLTSEIDEVFCCEICVARMWSPYVLTCGHTFCKSCLIGWFETIYRQHRTANPFWEPHARPDLRQLELARQGVAPFAQALNPPKYTCLTCREPATAPPAQLYIAKAAVSVVAFAQGEKNPHRDGHPGANNAFKKYFPWKT